jgi:hypothetical protein
MKNVLCSEMAKHNFLVIYIRIAEFQNLSILGMKFEFPAKMPTLFLPGLFSPHFANWAGLCSSTLVILYLFSMGGHSDADTKLIRKSTSLLAFEPWRWLSISTI